MCCRTLATPLLRRLIAAAGLRAVSVPDNQHILEDRPMTDPLVAVEGPVSTSTSRAKITSVLSMGSL